MELQQVNVEWSSKIVKGILSASGSNNITDKIERANIFAASEKIINDAIEKNESLYYLDFEMNDIPLPFLNNMVMNVKACKRLTYNYLARPISPTGSYWSNIEESTGWIKPLSLKNIFYYNQIYQFTNISEEYKADSVMDKEHLVNSYFEIDSGLHFKTKFVTTLHFYPINDRANQVNGKFDLKEISPFDKTFLYKSDSNNQWMNGVLMLRKEHLTDYVSAIKDMLLRPKFVIKVSPDWFYYKYNSLSSNNNLSEDLKSLRNFTVGGKFNVECVKHVGKMKLIDFATWNCLDASKTISDRLEFNNLQHYDKESRKFYSSLYSAINR